MIGLCCFCVRLPVWGEDVLEQKKGKRIAKKDTPKNEQKREKKGRQVE